MADGVVTVFDNYGLAFEVIDPLERASGAAGDGNLIEAPMPGLVKAVFTQVGQSVSAGDRLAVLEAMKMEHSLLAARDGVVAEVLAAEGDQVEAGAALVRLEPAEAADGAEAPE
jgi:3-methylcrotonyl-CoA carboxylase alpha subunit